MKKSTHTPGPWEVSESGFHVYYLNPQIEAGDETIDDPSHDSIVAQCDGMGAFSGIPDENRLANARLIAAAPDLLDSLKEMVADLISHATLGMNDREVAMLNKAETAIAKAEAAE